MSIQDIEKSNLPKEVKEELIEEFKKKAKKPKTLEEITAKRRELSKIEGELRKEEDKKRREIRNQEKRERELAKQERIEYREQSMPEAITMRIGSSHALRSNSRDYLNLIDIELETQLLIDKLIHKYNLDVENIMKAYRFERLHYSDLDGKTRLLKALRIEYNKAKYKKLHEGLDK